MNKKFRKIIEIIVEKTLLLSGVFTTLIIFLIVIFLFKEGFGLFNSPVIEEGYSVIINKDNKIKTFTTQQLTDIFDRNINNWDEIGGANAPIKIFYIDQITDYVSEEQLGSDFENVSQCINLILEENPNIIAFIPQEYLGPVVNGHIIDMGDFSVSDFVTGEYWSPSSQPAPLYGLLPLISGTLWVSFCAILIALPIGLAIAIYISELASKRVRGFIKPMIELLAGIPSVVYGFFGLVVIVPMIQKVFGLPVGETGFAGSIILAIMALPTIITVAEDSIRQAPESMREASLALGATKLQTIFRVILPCSISGITAAAVLGIGRAIGETMAVLMVTGNAAVIPTSIFEPMRTIPAAIAAELGESPAGGAHYQALFMLGIVLFLITLIISVSVELINSKHKKNAI